MSLKDRRNRRRLAARPRETAPAPTPAPPAQPEPAAAPTPATQPAPHDPALIQPKVMPVPAAAGPLPLIQPPDSMVTVFFRAARRRWLLSSMVLGLLVLVGVGCAIMFNAAGPQPIPEPEPTQEPEPSQLATSTPVPVTVVVTATPPPLPLTKIVPLNQQAYDQYRFYHAWEEYVLCKSQYDHEQGQSTEASGQPEPEEPLTEEDVQALLATETAAASEGEVVVPTPELEPAVEPTPVPEAWTEQQVLVNLQFEIRWLQERYATGECFEEPQFLGMPGRMQWLNWASGYGTGPVSQEPEEVETPAP